MTDFDRRLPMQTAIIGPQIADIRRKELVVVLRRSPAGFGKPFGFLEVSQHKCPVTVLNPDPLDGKRKQLYQSGIEWHCAVAYDIASIFYFGSKYDLNFPEYRELYEYHLSKYEISNIKQLRKVIKDYINQLQEGG